MVVGDLNRVRDHLLQRQRLGRDMRRERHAGAALLPPDHGEMALEAGGIVLYLSRSAAPMVKTTPVMARLTCDSCSRADTWFLLSRPIFLAQTCLNAGLYAPDNELRLERLERGAVQHPAAKDDGLWTKQRRQTLERVFIE